MSKKKKTKKHTSKTKAVCLPCVSNLFSFTAINRDGAVLVFVPLEVLCSSTCIKQHRIKRSLVLAVNCQSPKIPSPQTLYFPSLLSGHPY